MTTERDGPARPTFRAVFEAEFSYVCRTLRRFGVPDRDVPDIAHDVFVAVHARLEEYDPARPLRPWLFAFAFRLASKYRERAQNRNETLGEGPERPDGALGADEQISSGEARRLVLAALASVEPDRRAVLVLHELDGEAVPEIAAALGIPLNTAYSRLRVARDEFRAAVKRLQKREAK